MLFFCFKHLLLLDYRAANPAMPMLSVAPEGTLSHGRCVLKFKTGAFVAGVPVVPILLRYRLAPHNPAWTIIIPFWHVVSQESVAQLACKYRQVPKAATQQRPNSPDALYINKALGIVSELWVPL